MFWASGHVTVPQVKEQRRLPLSCSIKKLVELKFLQPLMEADGLVWQTHTHWVIVWHDGARQVVLRAVLLQTHTQRKERTGSLSFWAHMSSRSEDPDCCPQTISFINTSHADAGGSATFWAAGELIRTHANENEWAWQGGGTSAPTSEEAARTTPC